jgi:hypothetical protein
MVIALLNALQEWTNGRASPAVEPSAGAGKRGKLKPKPLNFTKESKQTSG